MAGEWFAGLGQTIAGGIATAVTFGQVQEVNDWTAQGARKVANNAEKTWGKDGDVTKFAESLPGVGYVASAGHAIAGDEQRARRAAASSTKSTIVAGATVGGAMVAGPAGAYAGAAAGGLVGSTAGQCAEMGINHSIDKRYRTDAGTFNEFDAGKFTQTALVDGALGGVGTGASSTVGKNASRAVVGESLKEGGKAATRNVGRYVVKRGVEGTVSGVAQAPVKAVFKK